METAGSGGNRVARRCGQGIPAQVTVPASRGSGGKQIEGKSST
jgi:hypothetical protein